MLADFPLLIGSSISALAILREPRKMGWVPPPRRPSMQNEIGTCGPLARAARAVYELCNGLPHLLDVIERPCPVEKRLLRAVKPEDREPAFAWLRLSALPGLLVLLECLHHHLLSLQQHLLLSSHRQCRLLRIVLLLQAFGDDVVLVAGSCTTCLSQ